MRKRNTGLSMIEILLAITILAVLLMNSNFSGFAYSKEQKLIHSVMNDIVSAIAMARMAAVNEGTMVTFCRSNDGINCQGKWHDGSIIFTDRNADRIINEDDRLLYRLNNIKADGELTFRSFRNRQYLQFTPRGITNYQNGNFTFCPHDGELTLAQQVIVSLTGRTRFAKDRDGDQVVENSRGQPLECE